MKSKCFIVEEEFSNHRVDKYLSIKNPELSRSLISSSIIKVNNKEVKPSFKIKENDNISLEWEEIIKDKIVANNIPLNIIYEDEYIIVINKDYDMVVHPGFANYDNTLVNALAYYLGDSYIDMEKDSLRCGIVHRLDKETSGVMVVAKTLEAKERLVRQFAKRRVTKYYYAIVKNMINEKEGFIDTNIARDKKVRTRFTTSEKEGKEALTEYNLIQNFDDSALLNIHLLTGRTHQIRVHFQSINHPLIGDSIYNKKDKKNNLMLQSYYLKFKHPFTKEIMEFKLDLNDRLKEYCLSKDSHFSL